MYKSITSLIKECTSWKNNNPSAYFYKIYSLPAKLQYIIEAIADDGTYEGITKSFIIPLSSIMIDRISNDQFQVFERYRNALLEMHAAERDLIKMFTSEIN